MYDAQFEKNEQEWDEIKKEIVGDYFEQLNADQEPNSAEDSPPLSEAIEVSHHFRLTCAF